MLLFMPDSCEGISIIPGFARWLLLTGRSQSESTALQDQQDLIRKLMQERRANEARTQGLASTMNNTTSLRTTITAGRALDTWSSSPSSSSSDGPPPHVIAVEMLIYCRLIKRILHDIELRKRELEMTRYCRIIDGVWRLYQVESSLFDGRSLESIMPKFLTT